MKEKKRVMGFADISDQASLLEKGGAGENSGPLQAAALIALVAQLEAARAEQDQHMIAIKEQFGQLTAGVADLTAALRAVTALV